MLESNGVLKTYASAHVLKELFTSQNKQTFSNVPLKHPLLLLLLFWLYTSSARHCPLAVGAVYYSL